VFAEIPGRQGRLKPIAAAFADTAHFDEPDMLKPGDATLLLISGHLEGTGNLSAERLFRFEAGRLTPIELGAWQRELASQLPAGLAVWKGIYPDYETMTAETPVWKEGDGNCCPTGGRALIHLALKDQRIALERFSLKLGAEFAQEDQPLAAPGAAKPGGPSPAICGAAIPLELDAASFSRGSPGDDPLARQTAEASAPGMIAKAFGRLCELELLAADQVAARVKRVVIGWAAGADEVDAAFSREPGQAGDLRVVWKWSGAAIPPQEEFRDGILCAFRPELSVCDQSEP
jgi:hypothetical protein